MLESLEYPTLPIKVIMCSVQTISRKDFVVSKYMDTSKMTPEQILERLFHGKRKQLHQYIAGFVDGEGSFSVAIIRHSFHKTGWMINPVFQVYQHQNYRHVLELCKFVFKTGSIYRKSGIHPVLNFSVDSWRNIIEKIIPFFDKYPLVVKQTDYLKFKTIVVAMQQKEHHRVSGFKRLVSLAHTMNAQGKQRKYSKEYIFSEMHKKLLADTTKNPQRPTSDSIHMN